LISKQRSCITLFIVISTRNSNHGLNWISSLDDKMRSLPWCRFTYQ